MALLSAGGFAPRSDPSLLEPFSSLFIKSQQSKISLARDAKGFYWHLAIILHHDLQARSQKLTMGGCFGDLEAKPPAAGGWGFGGKAPSRRRHGGWGRSPQRSKILHFFAKLTSF